MNNIPGLSLNNLEGKGKGLKIGIVRARWNDKVVSALTDGAIKECLDAGVKEEDIIVWKVPGSYELPLGAQRMIHKLKVDAVICIGTLIKVRE